MEDLTKKPLVNIIEDMTKLDNEIDLLMLKYDKLRLEVIRRFPQVENEDAFKQKVRRLYNGKENRN